MEQRSFRDRPDNFLRFDLKPVGQWTADAPANEARIEKCCNMAFCLMSEAAGHSTNEDIVVYDPLSRKYAVIDAMGGMDRPLLAGQIVSEELRRGFGDKNSDAMQKAHIRAAHRMQNENNHGGACYTFVHIIKSEYAGWLANVEQAGDTGLIAVDTKNGEIVFDLWNEMAVGLYNAVLSDNHNGPNNTQIQMRPNTRLYVATDGLWDSVSKVEVAHLTAHLPIDEAIRVLRKTAVDRMNHMLGKPDNLSIIIIERLKAE